MIFMFLAVSVLYSQIGTVEKKQVCRQELNLDILILK